MTRLQRLEKAGYKVSVLMQGTGAIAEKNGRKVKGTSITNLHKKIFGYA